MNTRPHNLRRRGFTMIELIVAMMIVAVLSAGLYGALRIAFDAKESAETKIEPSRTAELAMEIIRQDFTMAIQPNPANVDTSTGTTVITGLIGNFEGTDGTGANGRNNDDVLFYTTADSPQHVDANGEIKNIELTMIQPTNSQDNVLVRRVVRNLTTTTTPSPDTEVICRNVAAFNVQYYDGAEWLDNWDSTAEDNTIPAAVAVTIELDRPAPGTRGTQTFTFTRVFQLACSTAAFDSNVNPNLGSSPTGTTGSTTP
jgi:type II secretion system protein J